VIITETSVFVIGISIEVINIIATGMLTDLAEAIGINQQNTITFG
jgi:hypothetical protein